MIYEVNGGFVISSHRVWIPGRYKDERTAKYAFRFSNADLQKLQEEIAPNRITFEMLQNLRKSNKAEKIKI